LPIPCGATCCREVKNDIDPPMLALPVHRGAPAAFLMAKD
jgi:hypothetical protein